MVQPRKATKSWRTTIIRERSHPETIIKENPGLKTRRRELFAQAYAAARKEAASQTGLSRARFPDTPPFTIDEVEDEDFWPNPTP